MHPRIEVVLGDGLPPRQAVVGRARGTDRLGGLSWLCPGKDINETKRAEDEEKERERVNCCHSAVRRRRRN